MKSSIVAPQTLIRQCVCWWWGGGEGEGELLRSSHLTPAATEQKLSVQLRKQSVENLEDGEEMPDFLPMAGERGIQSEGGEGAPIGYSPPLHILLEYCLLQEDLVKSWGFSRDEITLHGIVVTLGGHQTVPTWGKGQGPVLTSMLKVGRQQNFSSSSADLI